MQTFSPLGTYIPNKVIGPISHIENCIPVKLVRVKGNMSHDLIVEV